MDTKQVRKRRVKSVLIIEDEADIRNFIARVLELDGYQVLEAGDGETGMEIIKNNEIALVILDLRLPGTDGWSILRELKRHPVFSSIPVVVLTAIAETTQRRKTLRMGASRYLVKPLSAHSLSRAVSAVISQPSSLYQTAQAYTSGARQNKTLTDCANPVTARPTAKCPPSSCG